MMPGFVIYRGSDIVLNGYFCSYNYKLLRFYCDFYFMAIFNMLIIK
jgi:hypothetical protein